MRRAGLPEGYGFHALRHTDAPGLIAENVHPRVIQARLGHRSIIEIMDTYGQFPEAHEERLARVPGGPALRIRDGDAARSRSTRPGRLLGCPYRDRRALSTQRHGIDTTSPFASATVSRAASRLALAPRIAVEVRD